MINHIEKGTGLLVALEQQGYWLKQDNVAGWSSSNDAAVQAIIDAYPISATIAEKKLEIDNYATELRLKVTGGVSPEQASWPVKSAEAQKYAMTLDATDAPLLAAEAQYRGEPIQTIVDRVIGNANGLLAYEARIAGVAGKHKDVLSAMQKDNPTAADFRAVLDYDYKSDAEWPSL